MDLLLDWCCICAVNDDRILERNLLRSPALVNRPDRLFLFRDQTSASKAYNLGLIATRHRYCVFAHQDVYLPENWEANLVSAISILDAIDSTWAVAGVFGVSSEDQFVGHVWSSGLNKVLGAAFVDPVPAQSIDELVIIIDRDKCISFDDDQPGFHLYGADIIQQALLSGHGAYIIHAPVVHNSKPVSTLFGSYFPSVIFFYRKWKRSLPVRTPVALIDRFLIKYLIKATTFSLRSKFRKSKVHSPVDSAAIARKLGFDKSL
jgi:glycosyltransferase involved in cell wall biosynthesis